LCGAAIIVVVVVICVGGWSVGKVGNGLVPAVSMKGNDENSC